MCGAAGGYTTGPKELVTLLRNVSRSYLFSNAPPPPVVAASMKVIRHHLLDPGQGSERCRWWLHYRAQGIGHVAEKRVQTLPVFKRTATSCSSCFYEGKQASFARLSARLSGATSDYTTGPKELVTLLRNVSRPYLFSNAPPPPVVAASMKSLELVERSGELRQRLRENTRLFRQGMKEAGFTISGDEHPISPVMVGEAPRAVELASGMLVASDMKEAGFTISGDEHPISPVMVGEAPRAVELASGMLGKI
ncbi:aminotransferase class I and II domain-containing protein [Phthorimaea operculella]|nr:aminotransferase class I and II domain-containing protein [Phthorimaea operculella]